MSTFYLIDAHTSPIADSEINDVKTSLDGEIVLNGNFVIKVPDGVHIENPTSLTDLITQKFAGVLASYPGFTNIIYDNYLDDTDINAAHAGSLLNGLKRGQRNTVSVGLDTIYYTTTTDISPTTITQAILYYELYSVRYSTAADGRLLRTYVEEEATGDIVDVAVTADGTVYAQVDSGQLTTVTSGSDITVRVFGQQDNICIGAWAVIY